MGSAFSFENVERGVIFPAALSPPPFPPLSRLPPPTKKSIPAENVKNPLLRCPVDRSHTSPPRLPTPPPPLPLPRPHSSCSPYFPLFFLLYFPIEKTHRLYVFFSIFGGGKMAPLIALPVVSDEPFFPFAPPPSNSDGGAVCIIGWLKTNPDHEAVSFHVRILFPPLSCPFLLLAYSKKHSQKNGWRDNKISIFGTNIANTKKVPLRHVFSLPEPPPFWCRHIESCFPFVRVCREFLIS